jgi:hypothetical protein
MDPPPPIRPRIKPTSEPEAMASSKTVDLRQGPARRRGFDGGLSTGPRPLESPLLYKPYEGSGEEVNIIGRIRWFAREM